MSIPPAIGNPVAGFATMRFASQKGSVANKRLGIKPEGLPSAPRFSPGGSMIGFILWRDMKPVAVPKLKMLNNFLIKLIAAPLLIKIYTTKMFLDIRAIKYSIYYAS